MLSFPFLIKKPKLDAQFWVAVALILIFAMPWRLWQLGRVPVGLTWDEVAIAYNGLSVWETHRDEWLTLMPLSFKSFGDYKAPFSIYVNGFFTLVLGTNAWVVRLPFALSGLVAVASMIWLSYELAEFFQEEKHVRINSKSAALVSGFLLAISPWHVHFSRVGFESGMSLALVLVGIASSFAWRRSKQWVWGAAGVVMLSLSMYTYHSAKIVVPLMVLWLAWQWRRFLWHQKLQSALLGLLGCVTLAPLSYDMLFHSGAQRLQQTSLLASDQALHQILGQFALNFVTHLLPGFLVFGDTPNLRHGDGVWGVLLPTTFVLVVIMVTATMLNQVSDKYRQWSWWALSWIGFGLVPAAIGLEVPHANRALLALPGLLWLATIGLLFITDVLNATKLSHSLRGSHGERQLLAKSVVGGWFLAHSLLFLTYWHHYLHAYRVESNQVFLDGYTQAFQRVFELEPNVERVYFSDKYGQPYIFALWVGQINPYQNHHFNYLNKFIFRGIEVTDLADPTALVVATPEDYVPHQTADEVIYGVDHQPRFYLYLPETSR